MRRCLAAFLLALLTACSRQAQDDRFPPYDNSAEIEAHYRSKPEFYHFATPADLPADLKWEDGGDLPEIGSPKAVKGGTFQYFIDQYPSTYRVDGPESNGSFRGEHWDNIYVPLVNSHPNVQGAYFPGIARQWAVGPDKRTVYFRIDPDAAFTMQDPRTLEIRQEPCRAADFFFLFYLQTNDYLQDPWAKNHYSTKYSGITCYDDLTISVTLAEPKADPVYWTSLVPYCRKFYRDFGPDYVERFNWRVNPTTGAYRIDLEETIKNRKIVLARIKDWWARDKKYYRFRYNPDRVVYTVIGNMDKAFEVFRKGGMDYFPLNSPRYWYEKMDIDEFNRGGIIKTTFYNQFPRPPYGLYINCSKPLLSDVRVRLGLQHAMNIQKVIDVDMRGDYGRLNTTSDGYGRFTESSIRARPFSVETARKQFAEAGFTAVDGDGILKNDKGQRLSVELLVRAAPPTHKQYALRLQEDARKCGVDLKIEVLDNTSCFKKILEKKHDMTLMAWNSTPPYPRYWEGFHSDNAYEKNPDKSFKLNPDGTRKPKTSTNNITMTADPELDKVVDAYEKAATIEDIERLSHEASRMIYDQACWIPGWNINFLRCGYWKWLKWPEDFNVMMCDLPESAYVHWIDQAEKEKTLQEFKSGKTAGDPVELVFDKFKDR
ncbi:MAG: ABC transporter substrate-binding protein [Verrucomicrobiales bacterium]|nr:ABC transporter substrate-binding protein [Verrucomicrobiales bacterium]